MKPIGKNIVFENLAEDEVSKGGIVLGTEKRKSDRAIVVAVGKDCVEVKVGDSVMFKKYGPDEITIDGKSYLIGSEDDVVVIL